MVRKYLRKVALASLFLTTCLMAGTDSFIITVQTDNDGVSSDTEFTMPVYSSATYDYTIDCDSDGTPEATGITMEYTCSYALAGTYTVSIDGTYPRIYFNNTGDVKKLLSVEQWGTTVWQTFADAFIGASNLVINATDTPDLSVVTDMGSMFKYATNIGKGSGNWDWDVSHVESMYKMFNVAMNFNQDISDWNVSNVTTMQGMFDNARKFNQDLNSWDVSSVKNMNSMFAYCDLFDGNISTWDVSGVDDMRNMFSRAINFNQDISGWDVSNVVYMSLMFYNAFAFNQDIGAWNVSKVENMSLMFDNAKKFNQDLGDWDVSNVQNMYETFRFAYAYNQDMSEWDFSSVTTFGTFLLEDANLSLSNYDGVLKALEQTSGLANVQIKANLSSYCNAESERQNLIDSNNWSFTDAGVDCNYYISSPREVSYVGDLNVSTVSVASLNGYGSMFSIIGGADGDKFEINEDSGVLSFLVAPDTMQAGDRNGDNVYRVQVKADDSVSSDVQTIRVRVEPERSNTMVPTLMYLLN